MLRDIKASFFFFKLFDYIDEGNKLKLIRYNKKLKKILEIDIIYKKIFTDKYWIIENNGKGKIYDRRHDLLYEGGYSKGEKNGKGNEYDNFGKLTFDGEFLNGKRNGNGKEYYKKNIIYEGEYSKGERHGKGKEYDNNGNLIFDGEFRKGKKWNGKIKRYNNDTVIKLEGVYLNGKLWNAKRYDSKNNILYEIKDGKGYIKEFDFDDKLIFEGEFSNGKINGIGKESNYEGEIKFEGTYFDGKRWTGKLKEDNSDIFELNNGKGYMMGYFDDSEFEFEEEYVNGINIKKNSTTNVFTEDKIYKFESEYMNGIRHGKGKEYDEYGNLSFDGEYINGKKRKGKNYYKLDLDKLMEEFEYINNKKNGEEKKNMLMGN